MTSLHVTLGVASVLLLAGVLGSKLSSRIGVPALLGFLALGMAAGSDGPGGIKFDDAEVAQSVGIVALAVILFAGGLDTAWSAVRPVVLHAAAMSTAGVLITALVVGGIASWVLGVPRSTGLLVGAIVSSTDAAAVFSVLRSRRVRLRGSIRPLLELESGSNDPTAVFLTVGFIELVTRPSASIPALVPMFAAQMAVGATVGLVGGWLGVLAINRSRLEHEGLYPVMVLGVIGATYAAAGFLRGSGFLAVYVAGLVAGHARFVHKRSLARFLDGAAWFGQIAMFLVLGLLVVPSDLPAVTAEGMLIAGALILIARPLAVLATLTPFRVPWREQALVAWVGLRGAAPIILATFPLTEGVGDADLIFDVVFFVVLTSVLIQGTTISVVARRLGVTEPAPEPTPWPIELAVTPPDGSGLHEVTVAAGSPAAGRTLVELGLPARTLVVLVERSGAFAVPTGSTRLEVGDKLLVLATEHGMRRVRRLIVGSDG